MNIKPFAQNKGQIVWDSAASCEVVFIPSHGRYAHATCAERGGHQNAEEGDTDLLSPNIAEINKVCFLCGARFALQILPKRPETTTESMHFL